MRNTTSGLSILTILISSWTVHGLPIPRQFQLKQLITERKQTERQASQIKNLQMGELKQISNLLMRSANGPNHTLSEWSRTCARIESKKPRVQEKTETELPDKLGGGFVSQKSRELKTGLWLIRWRPTPKRSRWVSSFTGFALTHSSKTGSQVFGVGRQNPRAGGGE